MEAEKMQRAGSRLFVLRSSPTLRPTSEFSMYPSTQGQIWKSQGDIRDVCNQLNNNDEKVTNNVCVQDRRSARWTQGLIFSRMITCRHASFVFHNSQRINFVSIIYTQSSYPPTHFHSIPEMSVNGPGAIPPTLGRTWFSSMCRTLTLSGVRSSTFASMCWS